MELTKREKSVWSYDVITQVGHSTVKEFVRRTLDWSTWTRLRVERDRDTPPQLSNDRITCRRSDSRLHTCNDTNRKNNQIFPPFFLSAQSSQKEEGFKREIELSANERMNPLTIPGKKIKQLIKLSSTEQFRETYKSIVLSTHISVRWEFICLITERRCQGLALLITVRYMNGSGAGERRTKGRTK